MARRNKPGSRNTDLIQNGLRPTFLELAGAKLPEDIRQLGASIKRQHPQDWRKSIYYHYYEYPSVHMVPRHNGIRTKRYKLMHFYQFENEWEPMI